MAMPPHSEEEIPLAHNALISAHDIHRIRQLIEFSILAHYVLNSLMENHGTPLVRR